MGTKYYAAAPGAFKHPMPRRGGIAINLSDGCAYVLDSDGELHKFMPGAHLIDLGTFDTMLAAENAAKYLTQGDGGYIDRLRAGLYGTESP